MKLSENTRPISWLKSNAAKIIDDLRKNHEPLLITQNGEAAMVVQSVTDYEMTQETLALLKILAQSQKAVSENRIVSSKTAFARLRERRGLK
ncbi:MAG: type II toxin-antitoxin system Phd/YefM family antitoxin [Proteobacteria bacterium]|nr:type II toxin-antitoxin system Phd/YefM family antitoxin [Pseudomonadota bacterium]